MPDPSVPPGPSDSAMLSAVRALLEALQSESRALLERDATGLERAARAKLSAVQTIEALSGNAVMSEDVRAGLRECQQHNSRNGVMLNMRQRHTRQVVDLLLGPRTVHTYSGSGAPGDSGHMGRTLGTA